MNTSVLCQKKVSGCFCDNVYVKNAVHTNLIVSRTSGGTVSIPALDLANLDCLKLTANQTVVGCGAGGDLGGTNTSVGSNALSTSTGDSNVSVGHNAGVSMTTGGFNTIIGKSAGFELTTGNANLFSGFRSGVSITTGVLNTFVGPNSGVNTSVGLSGCVLIGNEAGALNTTNDRLMIHNTTTTEPLIDGDFAGDTIQFNGLVTLGKAGSTGVTDVHTVICNEVPLTIEADAGYIRINVNGTVKRLKLYDDVSPP